MQLTNILRDVREDLGNGRVYLPAEDLRRFGVDDLAAPPDGALTELVRFEAERAREWFDRGLRLLPLLDSRSASCVRAMTGIYRRILERIERQPGEVLKRRGFPPPLGEGWGGGRTPPGGRRVRPAGERPAPGRGTTTRGAGGQ